MPNTHITRPFNAYVGKEPYIFVSYSHKDAGIVYPELLALRQFGFRIWYDEGIEPGKEWSENIARAIEQCTTFIVYISQNSVNSRNVRDEINFALEKKVEFLAIHLEETILPAGLQLRMGSVQAILKYIHTDKTFNHKISKVLSEKLIDKDLREHLKDHFQSAGEISDKLVNVTGESSVLLSNPELSSQFLVSDPLAELTTNKLFPKKGNRKQGSSPSLRDQTKLKKPFPWGWIGAGIFFTFVIGLLIFYPNLFISKINPTLDPTSNISAALSSTQNPTALNPITPTSDSSPASNLIKGPANRYLPSTSDFYVDYAINETDNGLDMLISQSFLPISKENIAAISFKSKNFYVNSSTPQNGIYSFLKYAIFIMTDEKLANVYLSSYNQKDIVSKAFLVITPSSLMNENSSIIEFSSNLPICNESRAFKLTTDDNSNLTTSTQNTKIPSSTATASLPNILFIYSTCRVNNLVIAVWGETYDNLDGYNLTLPDSILIKQVNELFQKVIQKLPAG